MVDSLTLYHAIEHNVKIVDKEGNTHIGNVFYYESEYDSGTGEAEIAINNSIYRESMIESIEILD